MLLATAAFSISPIVAQAAGTTTLVVPFPAGGSTDALARMLQPGLQTKLGRTVVVENKSGAAGALGAAYVAKSPADGSSILVTFDSHAVIPSILQKPPLDVATDLVPVSLIGTAPYVVAANAERPLKSFADIVAAAKKEPGSIKYASVGIGTIGHLTMALLAKKAGVEVTHVPYRGGGPAMNDVLGGHVDLICGSAALIAPQLEGGRIRPIMQTGRERLSILKDTQTAIDAGFPDFEALAWWGVFAPKGTTPEATKSLSQMIKDILSEPEVAMKLRDSQQMTLVLGGPSELGGFFAKQVQIWGDVVRENDIKI
jgi:tripartite-type tricarboxylate transporter receptor subunit TctC